MNNRSLMNNSISTNGGLQIIKATGDYFCAQCLLQFANDKEYKVHYKSELHMYNIKRRMLDLVPATPEQFEMKKKQIVEQQKKVVASAKGAIQQDGDFKCAPCNKSFTTENTFKAHVISKKHKETEKLYEQKKQNNSDATPAAPVPKQPVITTDKDQTVCLFCDKKSADIEKNLEHMKKGHSFFISEEKYCVDVKGLLKHLGQKINITFLCILCENKGCKQFTAPEAIKMHMIDKGHCFMQSTVFEEYAEFYDFTPQIEEQLEYQKTLKNPNLYEKEIEIVQNKREGDNEDDCEEWESDLGSDDSEYEDEEEEADDKKEAKHKNTIKEENEDEEEIELVKKTKKSKKQGDGEWEDESEEENDEEKEAKKKEKIKQLKKYRIHRLKIAKATINERGELELPNGKTLGHRTYRHIYTQYYRPLGNYASRMKAILGDEGYKQRQLVLASQNFQVQLASKYQALKSYKEEKNLLAYRMHRNKINHVSLGMQNNNTMQHHFVQQCPL